MTAQPNSNATSQTQAGILFAISAYTMWGVAPLYFKQIAQIPALEILMHRIVWSVAFLVLLIVLLNQKHKVMAAIRSPKTLSVIAGASVLLAGNWLLFIWAINNGHLMEASLGYYINPLLNVLLGRLVLGETLRPFQKVAVGLAVFGVGVMLVAHGQLPWIALALAGSFGIYGLIRKQAPVDSLPGLAIETTILLPLAIVYWIGFASSHSNMTTNAWDLNLWLMAAGIVTTLPLLCFTAAAKRIMYSTLGFFQYIGPTIMFVLAITLYDEPMEPARLATFGFVWAALVLFSVDSLRVYRKQRKALKASVRG